jgi:hypothetical protein
VGQRYQERHRLAGARIEAKRQIEVLRFLRNGVNHNATNTDRIGRLLTPSCVPFETVTWLAPKIDSALAG